MADWIGHRPSRPRRLRSRSRMARRRAHPRNDPLDPRPSRPRPLSRPHARPRDWRRASSRARRRSAFHAMNFFRPLLFAGSLSLLATSLFGSQVKTPFVRANGGTLVYAKDPQGNRIPDFSAAGYSGGGVPLPVVPARVTVAPVEGDDRSRIQAALDYVASLPLDAAGFRGAVQLTRGRYEISGQLKLHASGVVLRGVGAE